ncbi:MAG: amidohydrolase family protein, partial [Hyphomicrobiaceae bacterium]
MGFLTDEERAELMPAEMLPHTTPIPTQIVSSDEYYPAPQSAKQKEVENRLLDMGDELGKTQGLSRRQFFQSAAGMAAAFVAMNETYGP